MRIRAPGSEDIAELTDWVESTILVSGRKRLSITTIRRSITSLLSLDRDGAEIAVELLCQEVGRLLDFLAGEFYPFCESELSIDLGRVDSIGLYAFLLCLSSSESFRTERRWDETDELFDTVVAQALRKYLGAGSRSARFGWPPSGDRPSDFRDAIGWLCALLDIKRGAGTALPTTNDGGLDVIVWKPLPPSSHGYVVLLAQATVQLDWPKKGKDVQRLVVLGWIDLGTLPATALAIPFVVPKDLPKLDELHRTVTMVIDRLRLCVLIGGDRLDGSDKVVEWTRKELKRMSEG